MQFVDFRKKIVEILVSNILVRQFTGIYINKKMFGTVDNL